MVSSRIVLIAVCTVFLLLNNGVCATESKPSDNGQTPSWVPLALPNFAISRRLLGTNTAAADQGSNQEHASGCKGKCKGHG